MRSCWVIGAILAVVPSVSAYAQQSHLDTRQQIEQMAKRFSDYYNNQDAAAIGDMFTKDAAQVSPGVNALSTGPEAVENTLKSQFKMGFSHIELVVDQVSALGTDAAITIGTYRAAPSTLMAIGRPWMCVRKKFGKFDY